MNVFFTWKNLMSYHSFYRSHIFWVNRSLPLWGLQVMYNFVLFLYVLMYSYFTGSTIGEKIIDIKNKQLKLLIV